MDEALKMYLEESDRVTLDVTALTEHLRTMTEDVIPVIVREIREAEQVAAELRYSPVTARQKAAKT